MMKITNFGTYEEYIKNREKALEILKNHNFDLISNGIGFNENTHTKMYTYKFKIGRYSFKYFEGMGNEKMTEENKLDKMIVSLWCLLSDYQITSDCVNADDFIKEFGYEEKEGEKIYKSILNIKQKLRSIFTENELNTLAENIQLL